MSNNPLGGLGNVLGSLFGQQAPVRQQDYQDFSQQYQRYQDPNDPTNESHFRPEVVQQQYRQMLRNAPPDAMDAAHAQAFQQLTPEQREQLARQMYTYQQQQSGAQPQYNPQQLAQDPRQLGQVMQQTEQQSPGVMDQLFGNSQGPLHNPLVKMALAGAAAAAASRFLGGGGGIGGALGALGGGDASGFGAQQTSDIGGQSQGGSFLSGTEV